MGMVGVYRKERKKKTTRRGGRRNKQPQAHDRDLHSQENVPKPRDRQCGMFPLLQ
jgi:hypothetical protein